MKMSELVRKRKAVDKARREYHSFMSVRTLYDISLSYDLLKTRIRLEDNLVDAVLDYRNAVSKI